MSSSNRIFVAAWEYPPIMSGESVVCRKTLENSQFDYDVCCGPVDAIGNDHVRLFPTSGKKFLKWPFEVVQQFKQLDKTEQYKVMMSRVMPPNGHLAGWLIKRARPDIKWVVYFSDPVWNSPFLKFSLRKSKDHRPNWLLMKVFGIPAKWAVRESDLLVFNNERLAKYVLGRRHEKFKKKVVIAPYGHEGIKPRPTPERGDGKLRLAHVGQIYGNRTFADLVAGAEKLKESRPDLFEKLEIRQVGFMCDAEQRRVAESAANSAFTMIGQVSYEQSIEEMYAADCLLVIDPVFDDSRKNIYIPGKLFDYMSTGRPILCIADKDSATGDVAAVVKEISITQPGDVYSALLGMLANNRNGTTPTPDYEGFDCKLGAAELDLGLNRLFE